MVKLVNLIKEHKELVLILLIFAILKLTFLSHPLVSLEYMYTTPAERIIQHNFSFNWNYLMYYFENMSNPLLTSFIIIPGILLFGFSEFIARFPILIAAILFLLTIYYFANNFYNKKIAIIATLLFALNPLIWLYSGQITTDIIFTFFISIALLFCINGLLNKKYLNIFISAIFIALAMLTKYIASLYYILILIFILVTVQESTKKYVFSLQNLKRIILQGLPYLLFLAILVIPYILLMFLQFGFVMHPNLVDLAWRDGGILQQLPLRIFGYFVWAAIFIGLLYPVVLYDLYSRLKRYISMKQIIFFTSLLVVLNLILFFSIDLAKLHYLGELHFGGLTALFSLFILKLILAVLLFLGELLVITILLWFIQGNLLEKYLSFWILYSFVVLATARPTQRYLMLILPPLVIYLALMINQLLQNIKIRKYAFLIVALHIFLFLLANLFLSVYEYKLGYAAKDIADYIKQNNLETQINFDIIGHNYYLLIDTQTYPLDNRNLVLFADTRPYLATDKSNLGKGKFAGEFDIVKESKVEILGIKIKDFVVAKRLNK
ncbi:glycosyltransferase family 39 protein [Candidatus Woesearchaeota archaeon]|nr:glycosyltransferase family 39 protein [Candidatus Woesearchaeota archaeon]